MKNKFSQEQLIKFGTNLLEGRNFFNARKGIAPTPINDDNALIEAKIYHGYYPSK